LSRNNQSRLGIKTPAFSVEPVANMQHTHVSISVPTQFVELPSHGLFYPKNHPLHNKTSIEIKHMTAKEEDILASQALIQKGVVLDRLAQSVIMDRTIDPSSLLMCDRNALFIATRISGYGPDYEAVVSCPVCKKKQDIVHELETATPGDINLPEGVEITDRGTCLAVLPRSGSRIEFRLLNGNDEKKISSIEDKSTKEEASVTDLFKSIIYSVDGNSDTFSVLTFIENMPAYDARHLRHLIKEITPNTDLFFNLKCKLCETESVVEVPIGVKFFWPDA